MKYCQFEINSSISFQHLRAVIEYLRRFAIEEKDCTT